MTNTMPDANCPGCSHREWHDEYRTPASANIPRMAWNSVFPGDEAGFTCAIGGHPCDGAPPVSCCPRYVNPEEQREDGVAVLCCPECAEDDKRVEMFRRREGYDQADYENVYVCPSCGVEWTAQVAEHAIEEDELKPEAA